MNHCSDRCASRWGGLILLLCLLGALIYGDLTGCATLEEMATKDDIPLGAHWTWNFWWPNKSEPGQ